MSRKKRILLTNDDGIFAQGLLHLAEALALTAELFIVAPSKEQSGTGLGVTLWDPIHVESVPWSDGISAWSVSGKPVDCVKMALSVLLSSPPDIVISGINSEANAGRNIFYSGTVGCVIEATLKGIPGIAVSCANVTAPNYALAKQHILPLVEHISAQPLPPGTFLNVNFPDCSMQEFKGLRLARQGRSSSSENPDKRQHPNGKSYYWLGGRHENLPEDPESDVALLRQHYAPIVPITIQELTDNDQFHLRKPFFLPQKSDLE